MGCSILAVQPYSLYVNMKMMKALWLVLSSFLVLYLPVVIVPPYFHVTYQLYPEYLLIARDVCTLIVSLNNVINPFLYYVTMKEFRTGYTDLLSCGKGAEN